MTTQSGILASQGLLDEFKNFNGKPLIIKISQDNTELIPDPEFTGSPGTLEQVLPEIKQHLEKSHPNPAYIVSQAHQDNHGASQDLIFASYIPDDAPIRSKMLYASTKNSLLAQLGSFKKTNILAWTHPDELTIESYFKDINNNDKPFTKDEQLLAQMNALHTQEQAAFKKKLVSMHEGSDSSNTSSTSLQFKINTDAEKELASAHQKLLIFQIDISSETITLVSTESSVSPSNLIDTLSNNISNSSSPFYALYNYESSKYAFIYCCPSGSKVKDRMLYASSKKSFSQHVKASIDGQLEKNIEVGDIDELDISDFQEKSEVITSQKLKFNKPKGPRRR